MRPPRPAKLLTLRIKPKRLLGLLGGALLLPGCGGETPEGKTATAQHPIVALPGSAEPELTTQMQLIDQRLTLVATDATLEQVLAEFSALTGIDVVAADSLVEAVTIRLHGQPIEAAIGSLLADRNYSLGFSRPDSRPDTGSDARPDILYVYARRTTGSEDLSLALADPDKTVRIDALAEVIAGFDDQTRAHAIGTALADSDATVRMEAVDSIAESADQQALGWLIQALQDPAVEVREAAVEAMNDLGGEQAAVALASALNDAHVTVREEAVYAMARIGGSVAIRSLRQAQSDPDQAVREAAAELLADLGESGEW